MEKTIEAAEFFRMTDEGMREEALAATHAQATAAVEAAGYAGEEADAAAATVLASIADGNTGNCSEYVCPECGGTSFFTSLDNGFGLTVSNDGYDYGDFVPCEFEYGPAEEAECSGCGRIGMIDVSAVFPSDG